VAGLRFFYHVTLRRSDLGFVIPAAREPSKLPHVLSRKELARLFEQTHRLKHRALLLTAYAAGLRVSELVALSVGDIDSDRRVIRVEQGKGARDRTTLLSPKLLEVLRRYWQHERPQTWLFPSRDGKGHLCSGAAKHAFAKAKQRAQIHKPGGVHMLRHAFDSIDRPGDEGTVDIVEAPCRVPQRDLSRCSQRPRGRMSVHAFSRYARHSS
jgi:integrase/recombinase XerD